MIVEQIGDHFTIFYVENNYDLFTVKQSIQSLPKLLLRYSFSVNYLPEFSI